MAGSPQRVLKLDEATIHEIIERLDAREESGQFNDVRQAPRFSYRTSAVTVTFIRGTDSVQHQVMCRNLSRGGIAFLLRQFVYPGTQCKVRFVSEFNVAFIVSGVVRRCRYVEGTAGIHEVGVAFDEPVDVAILHRGANRCRVLLVDPDSAQSQLLTAVLRKAGHDVDVAHTVEDAMLAIDTPFDLVLIVGNGSAWACESVRTLRDMDYHAPIGVLDARTSSAECTPSCSLCTRRPLTRDGILDLIAWLRCEPVVSTLLHDSAMAPAINAFVEAMPEEVRGFAEASAARDWPRVRDLLRKLALLADGCGFGAIAEAANDLLAAFDKADSPDISRCRVDTFIRLCSSARPATMSAAQVRRVR